eukprot:CAMPEP_0179310848 /NCGR_PEP_ID=MMETSP0797-20121207/52381_1 /TAXON_ID=47934 /ORGANISM="Dinophysis acuminata, Strain DAEP01" /LENGTH=676 /DNA_ID=CAMNT_0021020601 /DNA_START=27 /DNA_END=2054 /DNA_ORIENTATION=-
MIRKMTSRMNQLHHEIAAESETNTEFEESSRRSFQLLNDQVHTLKQALDSLTDTMVQELDRLSSSVRGELLRLDERQEGFERSVVRDSKEVAACWFDERLRSSLDAAEKRLDDRLQESSEASTRRLEERCRDLEEAMAKQDKQQELLQDRQWNKIMQRQLEFEGIVMNVITQLEKHQVGFDESIKQQELRAEEQREVHASATASLQMIECDIVDLRASTKLFDERLGDVQKEARGCQAEQHSDIERRSFSELSATLAKEQERQRAAAVQWQAAFEGEVMARLGKHQEGYDDAVRRQELQAECQLEAAAKQLDERLCSSQEAAAKLLQERLCDAHVEVIKQSVDRHMDFEKRVFGELCEVVMKQQEKQQEKHQAAMMQWQNNFKSMVLKHLDAQPARGDDGARQPESQCRERGEDRQEVDRLVSLVVAEQGQQREVQQELLKWADVIAREQEEQGKKQDDLAREWESYRALQQARHGELEESVSFIAQEHQARFGSIEELGRQQEQQQAKQRDLETRADLIAHDLGMVLGVVPRLEEKVQKTCTRLEEQEKRADTLAGPAPRGVGSVLSTVPHADDAAGRAPMRFQDGASRFSDTLLAEQRKPTGMADLAEARARASEGRPRVGFEPVTSQSGFAVKFEHREWGSGSRDRSASTALPASVEPSCSISTVHLQESPAE